MASLVDQVKQLQRSSEKGKQAWIDYCDESLSGMRDPGRHDQSTLQEFLDWWQTEMGDVGGDEDGGNGEDTTHLVVQIKNLQRRSAKGKQAWAQHCESQLGGVHDPSRQDAKTLQSFLHSWQSEGGGDDPAETGPPATELVGQIKELQRTDPAARQKWGEYCDLHGGTRDPNRHTPATLEKFLRDYSHGHGSQVLAPALAPLAAPPKSASPPDFIKQGAKLSKEFKQAWIAYCRHSDEASDPSKIGETFLREFAGYVAGLVQADLAANAGDAAPPLEEAAGAPAAKSAGKRPPPDAIDSHAPEPKKKLTIRKRLADEIRRLNAEGGLSRDIRIPLVAEALSKLEEHDAMNVLGALCDDESGDPIAEDPNQFIVQRATAAHSHG